MTPASKILPAVVKHLDLDAARATVTALPVRGGKSAAMQAAVIGLVHQAPPESHELAYMVRDLVQCTLPHRDPGDVMCWRRTNGKLTLALATTAGYPYGSIPRLLLFWLTAEAVRTKSRRIELGESYYAFLKELGFDPIRGGRCSDAKRVREQVRRLFACMISFIESDRTFEHRRNMLVADELHLWWEPKPDGQSWVELGQKFFDALMVAPVPLDSRVLRALKQSPLELDLYAWVCRRAYVARLRQEPQHATWKALKLQFGSDYKRLKDFQKKAAAALRKIVLFYPGLKLEFVAGGVVILPTSLLAVPIRSRVFAALPAAR